MKKRRFWIGALMALLLMVMCFATASAADDQGTITITYPMDGVEFSLYLVGHYDQKGGYNLTDTFATSAVDLTDTYAAATLQAFVQLNELEADEIVSTANGKAEFTGLAEGVYLVIGKRSYDGQYYYIPSPVLVQLPQTRDGQLTWDAEIVNKYTRTEEKIYQGLSVYKVWKDDGTERPESITVTLLCDGKPAEGMANSVVTLSEENDWSYVWEDLTGDHYWSVSETNIPAGYTVSQTQEGTAICITNTKGDDTPPPPDIPYTGQSWLPVIWMLSGGLLLCAAGLVLVKTGKRK